MRFRTIIATSLTSLALLSAKPARAYDMDCAIMLCMAGGFPSSAVCSAAYAEMIRRITPWPSRPPFGVCTYAAAPAALGGPGGEAVLDISTPDYAWLRRTKVLWWRARSYKPRDEPRLWDWSLRSCDFENRSCRDIERVTRSSRPWSATFKSDNGQTLSSPGKGGQWSFHHRAVMLEYGDYAGSMAFTDWMFY